jgi:hypothetical protein
MRTISIEPDRRIAVVTKHLVPIRKSVAFQPLVEVSAASVNTLTAHGSTSTLYVVNAQKLKHILAAALAYAPVVIKYLTLELQATTTFNIPHMLRIARTSRSLILASLFNRRRHYPSPVQNRVDLTTPTQSGNRCCPPGLRMTAVSPILGTRSFVCNAGFVPLGSSRLFTVPS